MNKPAKRIFFLILIFVFNALTADAQFLPLNAAGKCEATEVVVVEGFTKAVLYPNALKWLKGLTHVDGKLSAVEKDSIAGKISGNFEFLVYAQSGILRKVAGSVSYHMQVETKDGKYRYSFSDFVFHYYAQDRKYKMVKTGKTKPLEEDEAMGWQKLWTDHRKGTQDRVSTQVAELKTKIIEVPKDVSVKAEEKKVEW